MERIISYKDLPMGFGKVVYFRMETDPKLYFSLLSKGYKVINNIVNADDSTIYITGRRQDYDCRTFDEYKEYVEKKIEDQLESRGIVKPNTRKFNLNDLIDHKYKLPFVLKNENQNGGREKFLIATEQDYENLISACEFLSSNKLKQMVRFDSNDLKTKINYDEYLSLNFTVQDYIQTPSEYNTTVRILTSSSNDLLYSALKYKKPCEYLDDTTLLGYLLNQVYPISTKSIVSNTLSGGKNVLLGESSYTGLEKRLLEEHDIKSDKFDELVQTSLDVHEANKKELGIICGFDYIYDKETGKWNLLEYHSRPMVGDYSKRQGIAYNTKEDRITAEGMVRATALNKALTKKLKKVM